MYCILSPHVALRGWKYLPYAIVMKDPIKVIKVEKEAFDILSKCDGKTFLPSGQILRQMIQSGIVKPCLQGEYALLTWQTYIQYDNRFFPSLSWGITNRCDLNCRHCFNNSAAGCDRSEFTLDEAKRFLNEISQTGIQTIAITGGEPFLHPYFMEIIRMIYKYGMHVISINTNGLSITEETLDALGEVGCYPQIKLSFDGLGTHDWLRNRIGAEEQAKQAIQLSIRKGFTVIPQMNVYRGNLHTLLPTAMFLQDIGVNKMRIIRTADAPGWKQTDLSLTFEEYFDACLAFLEDYQKHSLTIDLDLWRFLSLSGMKRRFRITAIRQCQNSFSIRLPVCENNRNTVSVAADGEVFPCQPFSGYYRSLGTSLGNVKKQPLSEILREGQYIQAVCKSLGDLADDNKTCGRCPYFISCCGGCRAMATLYREDYGACDPMMCTFFYNQYPQKIRNTLTEWAEDVL